jgi:hypothetical protein
MPDTTAIYKYVDLYIEYIWIIPHALVIHVTLPNWKQKFEYI